MYSKEDIEKIAYELYKMDWLNQHHWTFDRIARMYAEMIEFKDKYEFDEDPLQTISLHKFMEMIDEQPEGISDAIYVCYDEFINAEFEDKEYIKELFNKNSLAELYERYEKENIDDE